MGEDVKDVIFKYYGKESNSNIAELLVKQNQLKGHDQNTSKKRVSYFVSSMKKRRRERNYALVERETKVSPERMQQELTENASRLCQLKQLSDQQIIDALRGDADSQAVGYTVTNFDQSDPHQFHCQLQPANVEVVSEPSELAPDIPHQHSTRELAVQYVSVDTQEGNTMQYQTVTGEQAVFITLDADHNIE